MKRFALTGVAGYIASRHLQAIKDTGNELVAACDPHDSVGILDRFFPHASFFTEFERFDRHLEKLRRKTPAEAVDYISVCAPNHLHDAHIRLALRLHADAICEKPLVLKPSNLDALRELEAETGRRVYTMLQLRAHPELLTLKQQLDAEHGQQRHQVVLCYVTSRGPWYRYSWKGSEEKSGGVGTNIGIHFFDLLIWCFGGVRRSETHLNTCDRMSGFMELDHADVSWFLSIDRCDLPCAVEKKGRTTFRSITVDGKEIEFTEGFTDLHTKVYEQTLAGRGLGIEDARPSIELAYRIRNDDIVAKPEKPHPMLCT